MWAFDLRSISTAPCNMAHPYDMRRDPYHCPDHFPLERRHPNKLAAWSIGLLLLIAAIGLMGTRL